MPRSSRHSTGDSERSVAAQRTAATEHGGAPSCPNCGDGRAGRYCATCGQNNRNYVRGLLPVVWELCRESFEVDSRLFKTLKLLLFKPGRLSAEFANNRRARYMSPVRLYLFSSFVFFLVLATVPDWSVQTGEDGDEGVGEVEESEDLGEVVREVVSSSNIPVETQIEALKAAVKPEQRGKVDDLFNRPDTSMSQTFVFMLARIALPPDDSGRVNGSDLSISDRVDAVVDSTVEVAEPPGEPERPILIARLFLSAMVDLFHDPSLFIQRFIGNLPIAMFFLLPFLAAALAICYRRRKRFFVEHLVFAMHVQTFSFVVLTAVLLIPYASVGVWVNLILPLLLPLYGLVALRRFYGDGWIRTVIKGWFVWWIYWIVLIPGLLVTFFLTA